MEDAYIAKGCLASSGDRWSDTSLFAVFDGHGGPAISQFCAEHLLDVLLQDGAFEPSAALSKSFLSLDQLLDDMGKNMPLNDPTHPSKIGCTAVACLVQKDSLIVANAGDSRAVLCRNGKAIDLTNDHKPDSPDEKARILKAGGSIRVQRVGSHCIHPLNSSLSVSRALGDLRFKKNKRLQPEEQLVSCIPEINMCSRAGEDEFLVMACDGVWDVLSSQDVVDIVREHLPAIRCGVMTPSDVILKVLDHCISDDPDQYIGSDNMTMILTVFSTSVSGAAQEFYSEAQETQSPSSSPPSSDSDSGSDAEEEENIEGQCDTKSIDPGMWLPRRNKRASIVDLVEAFPLEDFKEVELPVPSECDAAASTSSDSDSGSEAEEDEDLLSNPFATDAEEEDNIEGQCDTKSIDPAMWLPRRNKRPSIIDLVEAFPMEDFKEVELPVSSECDAAASTLSVVDSSPDALQGRISFSSEDNEKMSTEPGMIPDDSMSVMPSTTLQSMPGKQCMTLSASSPTARACRKSFSQAQAVGNRTSAASGRRTSVHALGKMSAAKSVRRMSLADARPSGEGPPVARGRRMSLAPVGSLAARERRMSLVPARDLLEEFESMRSADSNGHVACGSKQRRKSLVPVRDLSTKNGKTAKMILANADESRDRCHSGRCTGLWQMVCTKFSRERMNRS
jgi:protein phosphatase 2C family protein 2/3